MPVPRTLDALEQIERQIIQSHGDLMAASRALTFNPVDIQQWMASDPEVAATIANAQRLGWATLESEAIRRATGYDEEVWYQGEMVGYKNVYSDGLLQTLLKARVDGHQAEQPGLRALAVQVNVMPRASTYEEWQAQRQMQLTADDSQSRVDNMVVNADYEEVSPASTNGLPDWL